MKKTFYRLPFEEEGFILDEQEGLTKIRVTLSSRAAQKACDVEIYRTLWKTSVVIVKRTPSEPIQTRIEDICTQVARREKFILPRLVAWYEDHRCEESLHFRRVYFKLHSRETRFCSPRWKALPGGRTSFFESLGLEDPAQDISSYRKHEEEAADEAHSMVFSWIRIDQSREQIIRLLEKDGQNKSHLFSYYPQEFVAVIHVKSPGRMENVFAYQVDGAEQLHDLFLSSALKCRFSGSELTLTIATEAYLKLNEPHLEIIPWSN